MRSFLLPLLLTVALAGALLAAGCTAPRSAAVATDAALPAAALRPSDDLLERPDLQKIVERQTRRDSAAVRAYLTADDPALRARAAFAIGSMQDADAVPLLLGLLGDANARVRADAAFALGQSADSTAALPLIDALRDETDATVQRLLLEALGKTGGAATLTALPTLDLPANLDAARALAIARYGLRGVFDRTATDWLTVRLTAPDAVLREYAAYLFSRATPDAWRYAASRLLAASDSLSPDDAAQMHLARALGRLDAADAEPRLLRLLSESGDWRVRANAARALAPASEATLDALFAALEDPSVHVAASAAGTLADAGLGAARLDTLEAVMDQLPWQVWTPLIAALAKNERLDAALRWVTSVAPPDNPLKPASPRTAPAPVEDLPFALAAALGSLGGETHPAARYVMGELSDDEDPRIAYAALDALKASWRAERSAKVAPFYFVFFADALRRGDLATAYAAAPALADSLFREFGASAVLRETYEEMTTPDDIEPMVAIVQALGEVRDTTAVPFLLDVALNGPHPTIREAAATTLTERFDEGVMVEATGLAPPDFPVIDWDALEALGRHPRLTLVTDRGEIVLELDAEAAPVTVQAIVRNARAGRYDGVPFHRVVPNFVIQGGDYARADGFGGPGYFLPSEFTRIPYGTGTLGMASAGKDTEGSQFFVTHSPQPHLDGRYTAFGRVVRGQDVVDAVRQGDRVRQARVTAGQSH